jgi:hypothetical protein
MSTLNSRHILFAGKDAMYLDVRVGARPGGRRWVSDDFRAAGSSYQVGGY